jgi:hypothetical protein
MGALKDGGRGATDGPGRARLRRLLVVLEVAMTLVLLVGAGLMIRTFTALRAIEPGFDPANVVTMTGVVVINERLAELQCPGADPLGKRIKLDLSSWLTVIGVVKDARQRDWSARPDAEMYIPFLQSTQYLRNMPDSRFYMTLVVRASLDPLAPSPAGSVRRTGPGACGHRLVRSHELLGLAANARDRNPHSGPGAAMFSVWCCDSPCS